MECKIVFELNKEEINNIMEKARKCKQGNEFFSLSLEVSYPPADLERNLINPLEESLREMSGEDSGILTIPLNFLFH